MNNAKINFNFIRNIYFNLFCLLFAIFSMSIYINNICKNKNKENTETVKTDTVTQIQTYRDTITITKFKPVIQYHHSKDTFIVNNTDTIQMQIPINHYEFADSNYCVKLTGYDVNIDTVSVFPKITETTKIVTNTITKKQHISIGLNAGYGYGFVSKKFEPFIGIGLQYNIFNK